MPRNKRQVFRSLPLAAFGLLIILCAMPFIARIEAAPSAGDSALNTHHSMPGNRSSRFSWLGNDSDIYNRILAHAALSAINTATPDLTIDDISQAEGNGPGTSTMTFTVTRSGDLSGTSTVNFSTIAGTATQGVCSTPGNDYESSSGILTFLPTAATETITVTICGDTIAEPDETFTVQLTVPTNATISDADGTGTITNEDGSVTYTWDPTTVTALAVCGINPLTTNAWICPANWTPLRPTAAAASTADILIFDGSVTSSPTIFKVPNQTIAAFQAKNGINQAKFEADGPVTLTINGATGSDFSIEATSSVRLQGSNAITISLTGTGQQGVIAGALVFEGAGHGLTGANAGEIVFQSGSIFTTTTGFTGHPFGTGADGSVIFQSGASAFFNAGDDPFGGTGNAIVTFNVGSNQEFSTSDAWSADGRTYGNLTLSGTSQTYSDSSASSLLTVTGDLTIGSGATLELSNTAGGDLNIWEDYTNNGTLTPNGRNVIISGISSQTINTGGATSGKSFFGLNVTNSGGGVVVNGDLGLDATGPLGLTYASGTPTFAMTNGAFNLVATIPVTVTTTSLLGAGDYVLISAGSGGSVTGTAPTNLTIAGSGIAPGTSATLQISGSQLVLHVACTPPATPTITPSGSTSFCDSGLLTSSSAMGNQWYLDNNLLPGETNQTLTVTTSGDYTVTVTDSGCTSAPSAATTVTINPTPATPAPTNGGPYCEGATIQLSTATVSSATYSWTGPGGFTSSDQNPTRANATPADAGTYSVTVTVDGCTSAAGTTDVVVNATPATPAASNDGPYCEGATIQLSTATVAGATYSWTGPNGFTSAAQNPTRANATTADAGDYFVTVTVNGCTSAAGSTKVVVSACTVQFAQANTDDTETNSSSHTVNISVTRGGGSYSAVDVTYTVTDGTATTADSDYSISPDTGTLHWDAGDSTPKNIVVTVNGDTKFEPDETVNLALSNPTGATLGTPNSATLTILNDDTQPTISIDNLSINEGNAGTTAFNFNVSLSNASYQTITVNAQTADDSATTADSDYSGVGSTLITFNPGETSQQFQVLVNGDTKFELNDRFFVNLSGETNATVADGQGDGTILNDDSQPTISIDDLSINEGNAGTTAFNFNVSLSNASYQTITVNAQTADDSATTADSDYTGVGSTLITFNPGETSQQFQVLVNGDTKFELNDRFFVNLSGETNATVADGQGDGTILNDDTQPTISINNVTISEGNSGTTAFDFTVSLSNASYQTITVNAETADDTATTADLDYTAAGPTTLTFTPDTTTPQTFEVLVNGDLKYEHAETFFVNLSGETNSTLNDGQGLGTITNDDLSPRFQFLAAVSDTEGTLPAGGTKNFTFTVQKFGSTGVDATVDFATQDGAVNPATGNASPACGGSFDYQHKSGTLTFGPTETSKTITILVCRDAVYEANETFLVTLTNPVDGRLLPGEESDGTIVNDDSPGSTLVVNTTADHIVGTCDPLPGGDCTLREAIAAANSGTLAVGITFNIPADDLQHYYYADDNTGSPGTPNGTVTLANVTATTATNDTLIAGIDPDWAHSWWTIKPSDTFGLMPATNKSVVIDGYTQCPNPTQCAQTNASAGSTNAVLRVEVDGENAGASSGLTIGGTFSIVRGLIINRYAINGLTLSAGGSAATGNFIGTDVSGTLDLGNTGHGVNCTSSSMTIGGSDSPALANLISGNNGDGVAFVNSNSNLVRNNLIGTKSNGSTALGNTGNGISFTSGGSLFNTIGGTATNEPNTIAYNGADGLSLPSAGNSNSIRGNSIYSNGTTNLHLGIDLEADGVTANDPLDPDSGPNKLQNFPIIRNALAGTPNRIRGTLNSEANQTYTIDLYSNPACDTSGNGEGKTYLGSTTAATDASGNALWSFNPTTLNAGDFVTATATDSLGSTSEFSVCFQATALNNGTAQFVGAPYADSETNADHTVTITVSRSGGTDLAMDVTYQTSDGTATVADNDYVAASGTLHWNNGETGAKTFTITVKGDTIFEGNETVNITLSGATISGANPTTLTITNDDPQPTLAINDVSLAEGNAGTTNFTFTVTKTNDGPVSVNFQTQNGTATLANNDYQTNSGSLTFGPLETQKTITVLVNGDTAPELDETFSVVLSGEVGATLSDGTGVGTILNDDESATAGQLIISEFRFSGPGANPTEKANNEFIEIYNNTNQPVFVTTTDGSAGWAVATSNGVEVFHMPNGVTIPARGHFLGTNTNGYSLNSHPAGDGSFATGNATWSTDVPDNSALALFRTSNPANFNSGSRLDSAGPTTESNTLYREGAGYAPLAPADLALNLEHTFFRQICVFQEGCPTPGRPRDTENNGSDFIFADTSGTATSAGQRLGSPGPENLSSPIKRDPAVNLLLLDASVSEASAPNRDRNITSDSANASLFGTMKLRRRIVNQTGGTVTRLRFRVIDITTHPSGVFADLRLRSSANEVVLSVNDANSCAVDSLAAPCTLSVKGVTLEQPPNYSASTGAGMNSTVTVTLPGGGLPNGQSINVNFLLGVQKTGQFKFYMVIEALP